MQDAIPFQTAYLAGYVADKYDVSAEDSIERANKRIRRSTEETFQQTVTGYDSVKVDNSSIQLHGGKAKYALFPVWLLSTSWRGENYLFAMNGQTGRFVGDLPVDKGRCPQVDAGPYGCPFRRVLRRDVAAVAGTDPVKEGRTMKKDFQPTALPLCGAGSTDSCGGAGCSGLCGRGRLCRPVLPHVRRR